MYSNPCTDAGCTSVLCQDKKTNQDKRTRENKIEIEEKRIRRQGAAYIHVQPPAVGFYFFKTW